jgi:hypothetical protein
MELDDLFSTHAVTRGQAPGDRNSGLALSILAEKDETPLGPMAKNQQRGWQGIAEMVLSTMKQLMEDVDETLGEFDMDPMEVSDVHMARSMEDADEEITWTAADLPDNPVVNVPLEAVTPRSQAAVQDAMFKLAQTFPWLFQNMTPQQIAAIMRAPDQTAFAAISTVVEPSASVAATSPVSVSPARVSSAPSEICVSRTVSAASCCVSLDSDTRASANVPEAMSPAV